MHWRIKTSLGLWKILLSVENNRFFPFFLIQVILKDMNMKFEMKGSVNGHYFEIEGEGKGKPYE